jgi:hypothetical protein
VYKKPQSLPAQADGHGRVSWQVSPRSFVQIFDITLLPKCLRIAKPGLCPNPWFELAPVPELDPTVKGNRFSGWLRKGCHNAHLLHFAGLLT